MTIHARVKGKGHILDCELAELHSSCELFPQFTKQDVTPLSFRHGGNTDATRKRLAMKDNGIASPS